MGKREVVQAIASVGVRVSRLVFRDEGEHLGESAVTVAVGALSDSRISHAIEKVSDEKLGGVLTGGAGGAHGAAREDGRLRRARGEVVGVAVGGEVLEVRERGRASGGEGATADVAGGDDGGGGGGAVEHAAEFRVEVVDAGGDGVLALDAREGRGARPGRGVQKLAKTRGGDLPEGLVRVVGAPGAHDEGSGREVPVRVEVKQAREELALRQVSGGAEHDEAQALAASLHVRRKRHGGRGEPARRSPRASRCARANLARKLTIPNLTTC